MDLADLRERFESRDWQETEPDPDDPVRLALIGLGWWTTDRLLPAVAAEDGVQATVFVSADLEKAERIAAEASSDAVPRAGAGAGAADESDAAGGAEHGAATIDYADYHDGAAADEYDAVYVGTPNATHLEYVETAADLGKAVLCEKPLEASVERAERLVEASSDVPAMTAYRLQTEPAVRVARELVREGFVGEPVAVQAHMTGSILSIGGPGQWRLDPELAGPGVSTTDIGVYPINTARFLLEEDPIAAHASMHSDHEAFGDVPDERASFLLEFPGGVTASCTVSQRAQSSSALRLIGTEGEVRLDPGMDESPRRELHLASGDLRTTLQFPTVDQMREEVGYFADRLRSGGEIEPDAADGLADVRTIRAIHDAAEREERVEL